MAPPPPGGRPGSRGGRPNGRGGRPGSRGAGRPAGPGGSRGGRPRASAAPSPAPPAAPPDKIAPADPATPERLPSDRKTEILAQAAQSSTEKENSQNKGKVSRADILARAEYAAARKAARQAAAGAAQRAPAPPADAPLPGPKPPPGSPGSPLDQELDELPLDARLAGRSDSLDELLAAGDTQKPSAPPSSGADEGPAVPHLPATQAAREIAAPSWSSDDDAAAAADTDSPGGWGLSDDEGPFDSVEGLAEQVQETDAKRSEPAHSPTDPSPDSTGGGGAVMLGPEPEPEPEQISLEGAATAVLAEQKMVDGVKWLSWAVHDKGVSTPRDPALPPAPMPDHAAAAAPATIDAEKEKVPGQSPPRPPLDADSTVETLGAKLVELRQRDQRLGLSPGASAGQEPAEPTIAEPTIAEMNQKLVELAVRDPRLGAMVTDLPGIGTPLAATMALATLHADGAAAPSSPTSLEVAAEVATEPEPEAEPDPAPAPAPKPAPRPVAEMGGGGPRGRRPRAGGGAAPPLSSGSAPPPPRPRPSVAGGSGGGSGAGSPVGPGAAGGRTSPSMMFRPVGGLAAPPPPGSGGKMMMKMQSLDASSMMAMDAMSPGNNQRWSAEQSGVNTRPPGMVPAPVPVPAPAPAPSPGVLAGGMPGMGGPLSEDERERQQSVTTSIEEAKQRERDGVITHIIKDFHHPQVQPTLSSPLSPAWPSKSNNSTPPRSASPIPFSLTPTTGGGSGSGSPSGHGAHGARPPPGSAGGAAPPPPSGAGRGRRPPSAPASPQVVAPPPPGSGSTAPRPTEGAPRTTPRPRPTAGPKPPPPGGAPRPAGPPPPGGRAGARRPKSGAPSVLFRGGGGGRGRGGARGGGGALGRGVGRAPPPPGSAPPPPRPAGARPKTASRPPTALAAGAEAISTDMEARRVQSDAPAPSPSSDAASADIIVPIGKPGGLHAREQQREMTARQRLERERREKAKEREAAEATAKAVAEVERVAMKRAEEEAAAAVPSIELGAPGGLHAKIEAEKAKEALLPSAAESRARLKREAERKVREEQEAREREREVEVRVAERLEEERLAREKEEEQKRLEAERKEAEMMRVAEEARKSAAQRAEIEKAKAIADEARRREADRRKMGMTPTIIIPETPAPGALGSDGSNGGPPVPALSPDILGAQTPVAAASSQPVPTPIHQRFPTAPQAQGMAMHSQYGQWESPGSPLAGDVSQNLNTSFDTLDEMPRAVSGADSGGGDMADGVAQLMSKLVESFCLPKMDECLVVVDQHFGALAATFVIGAMCLISFVFMSGPAEPTAATGVGEMQVTDPSGYGAGGEQSQVLQVDLAQQVANDAAAAAHGATQQQGPYTGTVLDLFAAPLMGSMTGHNLQEIEGLKHAAHCAQKCLDYGPACVSFDFAAMYERCYLGSGRLKTHAGEATNGATEFLYYERLAVPGMGAHHHAGGGSGLHPEALALMKDAFEGLQKQSERHAELVDSHVSEMRTQKQEQQQQDMSSLDMHTSVVAALHQQVMQQSGAINEHASNLEAVVAALQNDLPSLRSSTPKQHCQPGFSGVGCMDMIASVESPQHVMHLLRTAADKAANMTLILPAENLQFHAASIDFPAERIVGVFGGRVASLDASSVATLSNVGRLNVHGALSEVRLDTLALVAETTDLYISVGTGARFTLQSCEIYGEVHFRYAGSVHVHDTLFHKSRTVFALMHHSDDAGGALGDSSATTGPSVYSGVMVHPPMLSIEDSEVIDGQMLLNAPEISRVSIVGVTFAGTVLDLRAPPRSTSTGVASLATDNDFSMFSMVSCELSETRGTIGLAGTNLELSDTVVSNHTGPLLVCAPSYRGGGGEVGLHGMAFVHNRGINVTHREYLLDLSGCTTRGGSSSQTMPKVTMTGLTFLNNSLGVLNGDAAETVVESSSFHGNGLALARAPDGEPAASTDTLAAPANGGNGASGLFLFSAAFTLRSSRITAHEGADIAVCNPLGGCRVVMEEIAMSDSKQSSLVHMCTGHSIAVRHSRFSGVEEGGLLRCAIAVKPSAAGGDDDGGEGGEGEEEGDEDHIAKLAEEAEKVNARRRPTGSDRWRKDGRCGPFFPAPAAEPGECNPLDEAHFCCSASGWCGNTAEHCECDSCADYRLPEGAVADSHELVEEMVHYDPQLHRGNPRKFAMAFAIELTEVGVSKVGLESRSLIETHPLSSLRVSGSYFAGNSLGGGLINDRNEIEINGNIVKGKGTTDITNARLYTEHTFGAHNQEL